MCEYAKFSTFTQKRTYLLFAGLRNLFFIQNFVNATLEFSGVISEEPLQQKLCLLVNE